MVQDAESSPPDASVATRKCGLNRVAAHRHFLCTRHQAEVAKGVVTMAIKLKKLKDQVIVITGA